MALTRRQREIYDFVTGFVEEHGYTVPFAGDPEKSAYDLYATRFIPRNFVIDPEGTVLFPEVVLAGDKQ